MEVNVQECTREEGDDPELGVKDCAQGEEVVHSRSDDHDEQGHHAKV